MPCDEIDLGSDVVDECNFPPAGTQPVAIFWNYKDIESYVYGTNGEIEDVVLKDGKFAYKYTGLAQAFTNSQDFQRSETTGRGQWKHKAKVVIYERTQIQKNNIQHWGNARVTGALFLNGLDIDSIVLIGKEVGVQLVAGEIHNSQANDGFFILNIATPDGDIENESGPMPSIYDGDSIASTTEMLEALLPSS